MPPARRTLSYLRDTRFPERAAESLAKGCCETPILQNWWFEPVISWRRVCSRAVGVAGLIDRQLARTRSVPGAHGSPGRGDQDCPQSTHSRGPEIQEVQHEADRISFF